MQENLTDAPIQLRLLDALDFQHFARLRVSADDPNLAAILPRITRRVTTYGLDADADISASHVELGPFSAKAKVKVKAQDVTGEWFEVEGEELLARAMQHEIDHLDGVLFIDRLSRLKRDLVIRKIKKMIKNGEW